MEALYTLRRLLERSREKKKDLFYGIYCFRKAYDRKTETVNLACSRDLKMSITSI